jgi:hypothetical protein
MQIAMHNSLKPARALCASDAGKWAVPGTMRNFQSLALGDPGVTATQ